MSRDKLLEAMHAWSLEAFKADNRVSESRQRVFRLQGEVEDLKKTIPQLEAVAANAHARLEEYRTLLARFQP